MFKKFLSPALIAMAILVSGCTSTTNTTTTTSRPIFVPALVVEDQPVTAGSIMVKSASTDKPAFVVMHADNGGKPGLVIGNSKLFDRRETDLKISIGAGNAGSKVFAMLHYDNGDGVYTSLDEDKPVLLEGNVVVKPINLQTQTTTTTAVTTTAPTTTTTQAVKEFTMTASQWKFEPNTINVNQGDTVKLQITDIDVTHGFSLPTFGINKQLDAGKTTTVEFVADKKGTFTFACSVFCGSGHSGMNGKLVVE